MPDSAPPITRAEADVGGVEAALLNATMSAVRGGTQGCRGCLAWNEVRRPRPRV